LYENKRIRTVTITIYWLGRAARGIKDYKGPHLQLSVFEKLRCSRCQKPIKENEEEIIYTMDKQWHVYCATCCVCNCTLDATNYIQIEGQLYCLKCICARCATPLKAGQYYEINGARYCPNCVSLCGLCGSVITGQFIEANGVKYCMNCLCALCKSPLKDGFVEKDGLRYCPSCLCYRCTIVLSGERVIRAGHSYCKNCVCCICETPLKPHEVKYCDNCRRTRICRRCGEELKGDLVEALGGMWHKKCFVCTDCGTGFPDGSFFTHDDKPYCQVCYQKFVPRELFKCVGCGGVIENDPIKALDNYWHKQCFKCELCAKVIADQQFRKGKHGRPICHICYANIKSGQLNKAVLDYNIYK